MALDKEYFENIKIEVVKKKYYNAKKVEAVFDDIRRQAKELNAENERMRQALSALADRRVELGDAVLSAQGVYRGLVEKANERAEEIVTEARRRAEEIKAETQRQQDEAVHRVEKLFSTMKAQHAAAIDTINSEWQEYLCGLYAERGEEAPKELREKTPGDLEEKPQDDAEEEALSDLREKVGVIAQEIFEINAGSTMDQYEDDEDEDEDD